MLLSTNTNGLLNHFSEEKSIELIKNAGFDAYDFTFFGSKMQNSRVFDDDYLEYVQGLRKLSDSISIICNQAHAPFASQIYGDCEYNEKMFPRLVCSIECAAILGAKTIVIHPIHHLSKELDEYSINKEFYEKLLPYAEKAGVIICTENMWQRDERRGYIIESVCSTGERFKKLIDTINSPYLKGCLDFGHGELVGEPAAETAEILGDRMIAVHVHDNDCLSDQHTLPYLGRIDWERLYSSLRKIHYSGDFTFEVSTLFSNMPAELVPDALKFLCSVGRYMIARFEQ